jgi:hypothetical protein
MGLINSTCIETKCGRRQHTYEITIKVTESQRQACSACGGATFIVPGVDANGHNIIHGCQQCGGSGFTSREMETTKKIQKECSYCTYHCDKDHSDEKE